MAESDQDLLAKRRREARLAMEGDEARARRELAERTAAEKATLAKRLAAAKAEKAAAEKAAKDAALAAAEKQRLDLKAAQEARVGQIRTSEAVINNLKKTAAPTTLSSLRTLKTDLAKAVKQDNLSLSKIAAAGNDPLAGAPARSGSLKWWLGGFALLIILAGGAFMWWRQTIPAGGELTVPVAPAGTPLIFAEAHQDLPATGNGSALLAQINQAADQQDFGQDTIKDFRLVAGGQALDWSAFRTRLGLAFPAELNPYWQSQFMFGLFNTGGRNYRFLILSNRFYEKIYGGLLDWENNGLTETLLPLLSVTPSNKTTWAGTYQDSLVRNKDVRILKNKAGETVLFYGFLDRENVVFTTSEAAFLEVYRRFIATSQ